MKRNYLLILLMMLTGINRVFAQAPVVTSFSPSSGPIGTTVTITGSGFSALADSNVVNFGATHALITSATTTKLSVIVPAGASFKPITVSNKLTGLVGHSALPFTTTFSPIGADVDSKVRIAAGTGASDVRIADIDGDGKPDLIALNPTSKTMTVFRNISTAGSLNTNSFAAPVVFNTDIQSAFVAIDDLDGDGKLDIVLINGSYAYSLVPYNTMTLFRNVSTPGNIKFSAFPGIDSVATVPTAGDIKLTPGYNAAKIFDMDGDGKPDLVVLNAAGYVSIFPNTYIPGKPLNTLLGSPVAFNVGLNPSSILIGDVDGDGKPDIITANAGNSSITLLRNTSTPGAITTTSFQRTDVPLGFQPLSIGMCDVDGDGKPDVIIAKQGGQNPVLIHNTSTPGHFSGTPVNLTGVNIISNFANYIVLQDVDGDGKPDLISSSSGLNNVDLYTNKSTSGQTTGDYFNPKNTYSILIPDCIGDLDGDGRPDLVVGTIFGIDIYHGKSAPATPITQPAIALDTLAFHKAVSTNGDGVNDVFTIDNIRQYPDNQLTIVNADGAKVFDKAGYGSDGKLFDGHSNVTGAMQKPGTYFYKLQYRDGLVMRTKTGYFVLKY